MKLLHLKTQVDKTLSELVWTQCWQCAPHKVGLNDLLILFVLPGYPNVRVFFFLYPLNEIKIRVNYHSKNLFYESGRIWFKHKIKMHSIFVFICQVFNMQSRIYKTLLQRQVFSSANNLKKHFCHKSRDLSANTSDSDLLGKTMV